MIGLDTNVLVRYLVEDEPGQASQAARVVESADRCFLGAIVLCELTWVLEDVYGFDRASLIDTLEKLVVTAEFEIEDKDLVLGALRDFRSSKADFSDCLLGQRNRAAGCTETLTFDRALRALDGFRLLA